MQAIIPYDNGENYLVVGNKGQLIGLGIESLLKGASIEHQG